MGGKALTSNVEAIQDPALMERTIGEILSAATRDINVRFPPFGRTALIRLADIGAINEVRTLLQHGADVNASGTDGSTALLMACNWDLPPLVMSLLEAGADVDAADREGNTPLMAAAYIGNEFVVQMLLEKGADATRRDQVGFSAASIARFQGHAAVADRLSKLEGSTVQLRRD